MDQGGSLDGAPRGGGGQQTEIRDRKGDSPGGPLA